VHDHARLLVAGPPETARFREVSEPPVGLGDRKPAVVDLHERPHEPVVDARREAEHDESVPPKCARQCAIRVPTSRPDRPTRDFATDCCKLRELRR
jgi:hypothetical protein